MIHGAILSGFLQDLGCCLPDSITWSIVLTNLSVTVFACGEEYIAAQEKLTKDFLFRYFNIIHKICV